jgi:hypothetical protein
MSCLYSSMARTSGSGRLSNALFRKDSNAEHGGGSFSKNCSYCAAPQGELDLDDEPDSPFFDIPRATPGLVRLTPLVGTVQLSGGERFMV